MPAYTFLCTKCFKSVELFLPMKKAGERQICSCGYQMQRNFKADSINAGNKEYGKSIHSDAMAISPGQVKEHQQHFPDVKLDSQCRPVLENYQQHKKYAEKRGFIKPPMRKKRRGRKIG